MMYTFFMTEIIKDGIHLTYYDDGTKKSEESYKDQRRNGLSTFWYQNGNKRFEGSFEEGSLEGKATFWDEKGELRFEIIHDGNFFFNYLIDGRRVNHKVLDNFIKNRLSEWSKEVSDLRTEYPNLGLPLKKKVVPEFEEDDPPGAWDFTNIDHNRDFYIDELGYVKYL